MDINNYHLQKLIINQKLNYFLVTKPNGYTPKSGFLLCHYMESQNIRNKKVIEIGCGETGINAIHAAKIGATEVLGVDIDKKTINWASKNAKANKLTNTKWIVSDIFKAIPRGKQWDIIISNPPQMPTKKYNPHDSGGETGKDTIERIIKGAPSYLKKGGKLILLVFDFLFHNDNVGNSLTEYLKRYNFTESNRFCYDRSIRPGGKTEESLHHIQKIFPSFRPTLKHGAMHHKIIIITAQLTK